jgi:hypothetical protein
VGRLRWALVITPVLVGILIALTWVHSIENCNSCPGNPCPCSTDYRLGVRLPIVGVAMLVMAVLWYATRRRSSP